MKLSAILGKKFASLSAVFCVAMLTFGSTNATVLAIGDANELGFVEFGIPSGDTDRTTYVNNMIGLALGGSDTVTLSGHSNTVTRSMNNFGALPSAIWGSDGTGTSITLSAGDTYLFAKYDGPNYGAEVWDIAGLSGPIVIPSTGGGYGLSGWTLFTGGTVIRRTPEPATLALLGLGLVGLGFARRKQ